MCRFKKGLFGHSHTKESPWEGRHLHFPLCPYLLYESMFQNTDKFYLHGNCEGMCARTSTVRVHTVSQLFIYFLHRFIHKTKPRLKRGLQCVGRDMSCGYIFFIFFIKKIVNIRFRRLYSVLTVWRLVSPGLLCAEGVWVKGIGYVDTVAANQEGCNKQGISVG